MKRNNGHIIGLIFILFTAFTAFGQEKNITVRAENKRLDQLLEEVSLNYLLRFAFNADEFSKIKVTFNLKSASVTDFLNEISRKYHLLYEIIDQTYVLYRNPDALPAKQEERIVLEGIVTDGHTGEPLLYCHVGLTENKGTTTNELGIFSQSVEKTDQVTIMISHLGYRRLDTTLNLKPGSFHKIQLNPFSVQMETIRVLQQEKDVIEMSSGSERIAFNPRQAANLPRIDDSDLITALSLIPGVHLLGGQAPGISIRGGSPSENLILLDGIPILETSHLFGNMSVLNAKFVSQAFVSRGAFDATYGERVSGVVELTGQFNYSRPGLDLSANLMNINAAGEIPLGKTVSVSGAYRRSYIDQWENYLYRQILEQQTTAEEGSSLSPTVHFDDFNFKLSVRPSEKQEIAVSAFNSSDLQQRTFSFENDRFYRNDEADSKNSGISGSWKIQSGEWQHRLSAGYNKVERTSFSNSGTEPNKQGKGGKEELDKDDNYLEELLVNWSAEVKTGIFTHQFGAGAHLDRVDYLYLAKNPTGNIQVDSIRYDADLDVLHTFLQEKIQLTEDMQFRVGLRINQENSTNKFYFQPRLGVSLDVTPDLNLFYSGGVYNQFLSRIRKIDSNGSADLVWYLPDSTGAGIMKAWQHTVGSHYEKNGWSINVESYYKKTRGKMNLYAEISGSKEKTITYVPRPGESEHYGIDVMLHYKKGAFTHMLAWSVSKSAERFDNFNAGDTYPAFDDQRHRLRWTEMGRYKSWVVSANLTCHSGSPYLPAGVTNGTQEFGRLPGFSQTDFSLIKRFKYKSFTLSSGLSLLNIFDRENVVEVDYYQVSDETGSYSFRTDIRAMKFTPVFFINIRIL